MKCLAAIFTICFAINGVAAPVNRNDTIRIGAPDFARLDFKRSDGGLAPAPGLETFVVFRADKKHPELNEGRGWTYHHHPDMACWKGRLYVGWNSCERDEDTWPSRELFSTSTNGRDWSRPMEMFPQGVSTPLRMYFFHAQSDRMLVIAGLRVSHEKLSESTKGPLVVREIGADHTLREVFTLRSPAKPVADQPPLYDKSSDAGFIEACRELLANRLFLEQQDYGVLLDPSLRMKWNDPNAWPGDAASKKDAEDFGKAMCFFHRADGTVVGVGKKRWATFSHDGGATWSQPIRPPLLITGMGKVWGQRTSDGRFALVYNPDTDKRWPLAVLSSADGIAFEKPYCVYRELPKQRYTGKAKSPGASYVRGISEWSSDGSWEDSALWLVYSVNKEEIWVSRIPVPLGSP
jgi:hypothetical protein